MQTFGVGLKAIVIFNALTPYEHIGNIWTSEPDQFSLNSANQMPGLNTSLVVAKVTQDSVCVDNRLCDFRCGSALGHRLLANYSVGFFLIYTVMAHQNDLHL